MSHCTDVYYIKTGVIHLTSSSIATCLMIAVISCHIASRLLSVTGVYSQWPSAPYPTYPGAGGYPMPPMPSAYNAYNPYLQYPQPTAMQLAPASAYLSGQCPTPQQQGSIMGGQHPPPPPVTFPPQPQYGHNQPPAGR